MTEHDNMTDATHYVYISGMDEYQGPMTEREAWNIANDNNRLTLELNANRVDGVWCVAIVLDHKPTEPEPWAFTDEHPAANPIGNAGKEHGL